jgi:2-polyprenyl-6-methoxyphenol hydroxylase-like FAD-dependent oxidoreductase
MKGSAVVVAAGPNGLAAAILLTRDGYKVTVSEKDAQACSGIGRQCLGTVAANRGRPVRPCHIMQARFRHLLDAEFP